MINGLEGIPGSGKSYEAVSMHILPALAQGRRVITNLPVNVAALEAMSPDYVGLIERRIKPQPIRGEWDAEGVDENGNGEAFKLQTVPKNPSVRFVVDEYQNGRVLRTNAALTPSSITKNNASVFGSVWDYWSDWKHPVTGNGPLFIIDECHLAMPVTGTDPEVVEWFKLHRHFNADVLLATQSFRDMNQSIARLMAIIIKCRSADILGKKGTYIRKVHSGYRGAVISTEERKYRPEFFPLYKSHTQGNSVAETAAGDVAPFLVKFKRFSRVFYVITAIYCAWVLWGIYNKKTTQVPAKASSVQSKSWASADPPKITSAPPPATRPSSAPATPPAAQSPQAMVETAPDETPEPYATKGIHLTGRMTLGKKTVYTFAVSAGNNRISQVNSDELKLAGYVWQPLTDCAGTLRWHNLAKAVTCDAPIIPEGSSSDPVVMVLPAGTAGSTVKAARSDGKQVAFN